MEHILEYINDYWKTILGSVIGGTLLLLVRSLFPWVKNGFKKYRFNFKSRNERIKELLRKNTFYRERIQFKVIYDFLLCLFFFILSYNHSGWIRVLYGSIAVMIMFDVARYYTLWNKINKELINDENKRLNIKTHNEIIITTKPRKYKKNKE